MTETATQLTDHKDGVSRVFTSDGLQLDSGAQLEKLELHFRTYGTLNASKDNAILVCHALTLDHHIADDNPITKRKGWWDAMVGAGRPIDTDRFFVICVNVPSGCAGSIGPASINPKTNKPYGTDFPIVTIGDMVRAQVQLIDALGIAQLFCVIGGSMGGMQVLEWVAKYASRVFSAIPIATAARHSAQNIAFHEIGRQAILADPHWHEGRYFEHDTTPRKGLAIARMTAHVTYLSEAALHRKFGRNLQDRQALSYGFDADFQIESYLRHQGSSFVDRFDATSYLYITRAMDYFDLAADHKGVLARSFADCPTRVCVVSFTSDWLFPTEESIHIVRALTAGGANVSFVEIESDKGHDAFLLDEPELDATIAGFLNANAATRGLN